ncbi:MAG: Hpt domain-containing protein [Thermoanaerobaculia bacterium]
MKRDVDFVVLDGPLGWSDHYEMKSTAVELDGYMIEDLRSYREGLLASMLALFEDQTPMRIDAIRAAFEENDLEHLRHQAHELAGGASYVGAASLACHARAIETLAKQGETAEAAPLIASLDSHAERTIAALRVVVTESNGELPS